MYGHIHIILKDLVVEAFGSTVWEAILERAGVDEEVILNTVQHEDEVSYRLVAATCAETKLAAEQALEAFGRHFVKFALRSGYARFLKAQGSSLPAFLANVNTLHNQLERDHPNALFPYLEVNYDSSKEELDLHYLSARAGLSAVVVGVVKEIGLQLFSLDVTIKELARTRSHFRKDAEDNRACSWRVSWHRTQTTHQEARRSPRMPFAAFHFAMIDFGKLLSNLGQITCCALPVCDGGELDLTTTEEAGRKLNEIRSGSRTTEEVLLRATPAKRVAAAWCDSHLEDCCAFWRSSRGDKAHYGLSADAKDVDVFVSHSWSPPEDWEARMGEGVDYAEVKATTLAMMAKDFAQEHRSLDQWGSTSFWVDKACIYQDSPELKSLSISLIEKFLAKCDSMCVIFTWTYLERLWCVYEWACVLVSKPPEKVFLQTELFVKEETLPLYLDAVRHFSLKTTKCFDTDDRKVLEGKIATEYASTEAFETLVQATVIALMARSMAFRAGRSPSLEKTFFTPWIMLARELGFSELADSLQTCRSSDWRKMTSLNSTASASQTSAAMVGKQGSVKSDDSKSGSVQAGHQLLHVFSPASHASADTFQLFSPCSDARPRKVKAIEDVSPSKADAMGRSMGVNSLEFLQNVSDWFDLEVAPVLEKLLQASVRH